jgi:hypothetical protein
MGNWIAFIGGFVKQYPLMVNSTKPALISGQRVRGSQPSSPRRTGHHQGPVYGWTAR